MKKLTIIIFILMLFATSIEALTYKPLYPGESKCYKFLVKDNTGTAYDPNVGDVVTLTLKRTPNSSTNLLQKTGTYVDDETTYNYLFQIDSNETTSIATGDAYWYLELTNATSKVKTVIDCSKIRIIK